VVSQMCYSVTLCQKVVKKLSKKCFLSLRQTALLSAEGKKKPPPGRSDSPSSMTMPMATSTPATRTSTRARTTPHHLRDYVHGADLDSDSLGLLPLRDYNQSDLSDLQNESSQYVQARIQMQEEEMRARNAQEQARIQKGPRDSSPGED
jgi:hypothetical protein